MTIRPAKLTDVPAILDIYAPYITDTCISFEYEVPGVAEFAERIRIIQQQLPYLVADLNGQLLGYAYASRHRDRAAYQWSVDTSVYVHRNEHRQGIARQLYTTLFEILRRQGYCNTYAGITLPNAPSEAFHHTMGFLPVGTYTHVGYKFGEWHDVGWFQRTLQPHQPNPPAPIPITALR